LTDIIIPDPGPGEVLVHLKSCGVCHTYFHYSEGGDSDPFPLLLGHESAGVVSEVGEGVTRFEVGVHPIFQSRALLRLRSACKRGEPSHCFDTHNASQKMTLPDGTELEPALGIGSFAEKTLVAEGQCTKVREADPAVVGLLGCGVMAGIGAAINTGEVTRGKT